MNHKTFNVAALSVFVVTTVFLGAVIFWPDSPKNVEAGTTVQPAAMPSAPIEPISPAQPAVLVKTDPHDDDFEQLNEAVSYASEYMSLDTANEFPVIEISSSDSGRSSDYTASQSTIGDSFTPFSYDVSTLSSALSSSGNTSSSSSSASSSSSGGSSGSSGGASSGDTSSGGASEGDTTQPKDNTTGTQPQTPADNPGTPGGNGGGIPNNDKISNDLTSPKGIGSIFVNSDELYYNGRQLPLATTMENLLKYQAFWSAAKIAELHPEAWRTLRTKYPERMALHYIAPFFVRPDTKLGSYLDYNYVERYHPEWFLLKDDTNACIDDYRNPSKRMRRSENPQDWYYTCFYLDVGNPDFQDWAVEEFVSRLDPVVGVSTRVRYSGIAADMVMLTTFQNGRNKACPNWKYASGGWNQAYFSYLKKLHDTLKAKGYVLIVNQTLDYSSNRDGSDWQDLMNIVDGMMDEEALMSSGTGKLWGGSMWEASLNRHEEILGRGLYDWWECNFHNYTDPQLEYHHFLYTYCSFLLIRDEQYSLFGVHRRKNGEDLDPWYEEYTLPLGNPLGARYQKEGCWLRDYQYGKIVVNPSSSICNLTFDDENYTLDWRTKRIVARLTMEPLSATILLPTGYQKD
jgi:hypothetical protein